jgi:hypothetical protein
MTDVVNGSCLCGEVAYQLSGPLRSFKYCHCSRCRKVTGSAHAANLYVNLNQFTLVKGEALYGRYELEGAEFYATGFCKQCGSNLPWLTQTGQKMIIPAGSLDDEIEVTPSQNIFCGSQVNWYVDVSSIPKFDELPPKK